MEFFKYKLYEDLEISPRADDTYKILKDFTYKDVTVSAGYHTNGANIPRILWSIWPPNRSAYLPAVVIHDYLCEKGEYELADKYFKEILEILEIDKLTIWFFATFTRLYHVVKYDILKK